MFRNYFKFVIRNLLRNKAFSIINIFGLAAGLATCLLIMLYIFSETGYDRQFHDVDNIYRLAIRKVLGASATRIAALLSRDFVTLVGISILIACPLAWYAMNRWLEGFAYHTHIHPGLFLLAGLMAIGIALVTVSFQSVKAAMVNPVKSLRAE